MSSTCLVLLIVIKFQRRVNIFQTVFLHSVGMASTNWHVGSAPDSQ